MTAAQLSGKVPCTVNSSSDRERPVFNLAADPAFTVCCLLLCCMRCCCRQPEGFDDCCTAEWQRAAYSQQLDR
jgi:hypothetical protein